MRVGVLEVPDHRISTTGLLSDRKLTFLRPTLDPKCRPPPKGKSSLYLIDWETCVGCHEPTIPGLEKVFATTLGQGRTHGCEGLDDHHYGRPRQINYVTQLLDLSRLRWQPTS